MQKHNGGLFPPVSFGHFSCFSSVCKGCCILFLLLFECRQFWLGLSFEQQKTTTQKSLTLLWILFLPLLFVLCLNYKIFHLNIVSSMSTITYPHILPLPPSGNRQSNKKGMIWLIDCWLRSLGQCPSNSFFFSTSHGRFLAASIPPLPCDFYCPSYIIAPRHGSW